jgi:tellurite resistance protein
MYTKEQQFARILTNIAGGDGEYSQSEIQKIISVAKANDLNSDAVLEALNDSDLLKTNVVDVVKSVKEDDKSLMIFGALRVACADGVITIKELARVHAFCDIMGYGGQFVTLRFLEILKKEPSLKIESVDF